MCDIVIKCYGEKLRKEEEIRNGLDLKKMDADSLSKVDVGPGTVA